MPWRPSITEEANTLGALLRGPYEATLDYIFHRVGKAGYRDVRPAHSAVLRHVARDGSRITELAERARMTKQSMAELVEYLRGRRYVELARDPTDGRAKVVKLTNRGWKLHDIMVQNSRAFEKECARSLGEHKWRRFRGLLEEVAALSKTRTRTG